MTAKKRDDELTINSREVYTTGQVAKLLRVAMRTVAKWCDKGKLLHYKLPCSKDRRILGKDLEVFIENEGLVGLFQYAVSKDPFFSVKWMMYVGNSTIAPPQANCTSSWVEAGTWLVKHRYQNIVLDSAMGKYEAMAVLDMLKDTSNRPRNVVLLLSEDDSQFEYKDRIKLPNTTVKIIRHPVTLPQLMAVCYIEGVPEKEEEHAAV